MVKLLVLFLTAALSMFAGTITLGSVSTSSTGDLSTNWLWSVSQEGDNIGELDLTGTATCNETDANCTATITVDATAFGFAGLFNFYLTLDAEGGEGVSGTWTLTAPPLNLSVPFTIPAQGSTGELQSGSSGYQMTDPTAIQGQLTLVLGPGQSFSLPQGSADIVFEAAAVPEPSALLLCAAGLLAFGGLRFRR